MKLLESNISKIRPDIEKIKGYLRNDISKIGLFGSTLTTDIDFANDIDIVVYCKDSYDNIKAKLLGLNLSYPICPHKMNGSYGRKENETLDKHYHIILLNDKSPNKEFERINFGKIEFL